MKKRMTQHHMEGLGALLLFGIFAVCVLMVLLTGADAYRRLTERDQQAYLRRTCSQYVAARVRQADSLAGITVEPFGDGNALTLVEDGGAYRTRIYCCEGWLMELYCAVDADLDPEDGEKILEMEALELSLKEGFLTAKISGADGSQDILRLSLRSGKGAPA